MPENISHRLFHTNIEKNLGIVHAKEKKRNKKNMKKKVWGHELKKKRIFSFNFREFLGQVNQNEFFLHYFQEINPRKKYYYHVPIGLIRVYENHGKKIRLKNEGAPPPQRVTKP